MISSVDSFHAQINKGHLKNAGEYSDRNVVKKNKTIKTKTIVQKLLLIKIMKLRLRNFDN